ncbi:hypothetical protein IQ07DRAFT_497565 [Pyrenochaeta sp. DS3sAY3a]|nr:hypothetical protein IQ07DRAFT_497565 [Pyrenochaeta sp. DS3sAY3a]
MSSVQFTALIRLPFVRGNFEDPAQAQWDGEKDRQLWKVISKSSKTSDLNCESVAAKFQVPPTFLLQQAAWLYERHLDHVRNQMKKVSISNPAPSPTPTGGSTVTAVGGVSMRRTGSAGSGPPRTASALSGRPRDSPSLRGGETATPAPPLSRTPSTNTITQSRAIAQQIPTRTQSTRSAQRPALASPRSEERVTTTGAPPPNYRIDQAESPEIPASPSSSSSSISDTDHPAHRSQLFKRPPRFKQQRRDLSTFDEGDGTLENEDSGSHESPTLPFASAARRPLGRNKYSQDMLFRTTSKPEQKTLQSDRSRNNPPSRQKSIDQESQATTETASSMTSSASASDAPSRPRSMGRAPMSPPSNHRAELGRLGSPRQGGPKPRREGSEGTPSMGSSFSDIDDAGISQSALEEALLSNMQHGRMIDWTVLPTVTRKYVNRDNTLDLDEVFGQIKRLATFEKCSHGLYTPSQPEYWHDFPCAACEGAFTNLFWGVAAQLLDYFGDFYNTDTPLMNATWFAMFDLWQTTRDYISQVDEMEDAYTPTTEANAWIAGMDKSREFGNQLAATVKLIFTTLHGPESRSKTVESELHHPSGDLEGTLELLNTGPFLSGIKPWQQFLFAESPGSCFTAPRLQPADKPGYERRRQIPMPLIAILENQTTSLRAIADEVFVEDPETYEERMANFDAQALAFPDLPAVQVYSYISLSGYRVTYHLNNASPPIWVPPGQGDQDLDEKNPSLSLLNDHVSACRGDEVYEHQALNWEDENGDTQMGGGDEDDPVFDAWTVYHAAQREDNWDESRFASLENMFDNWQIDDEDEKTRGGANLLSSLLRRNV